MSERGLELGTFCSRERYINRSDTAPQDYFGNTEKLEEELLSLENVNLSYSLAKLVISENKHHETLETDRDAVNNT